MMAFLEQYNLLGLAIGVSTFIIIGLFHPLVIKAEYYWGVKSWRLFLAAGAAGIVISVLIDNFLFSVIAGVFAFSSLWSIHEVFQQRERVRKGWFPKNTDKKKREF